MTVLARTPDKLTVTHDRLTVIKGDATSKDDLRKAIAGADAVLSCLGSGIIPSASLQALEHCFSLCSASSVHNRTCSQMDSSPAPRASHPDTRQLR